MTDERGTLQAGKEGQVARRVQGATGQWFVMPIDPHGSPFTSWVPPGSLVEEEAAFKDEEGNVLAGTILLQDGMSMTVPLDGSLRPVVELAAIVTPDGETVSPNPDGWPLTEDEIDRDGPPPDQTDLPAWQREAMKDVVRDDLGQPVTTRLRAVDGGWADVLLTREGPLCFDLDLGTVTTGTPSGETEQMTLMRAMGGVVAVAVDSTGRPVHSPDTVARLAAGGSE